MLHRNISRTTATTPIRATVTGVCWNCRGDIWFEKPSGAAYCAVCGAPHVVTPVTQQRP